MQVNVTDLIRSSFRCIGSLNPGQFHSPTEGTDALFVLNAMLDSWQTDDLNSFGTLIQEFPLVGSQAAYTIGPGGNFNTARPTEITYAVLVVLTNPAEPLRLPLAIINAEQYERIRLQSTQSTIPKRLFYNPTYPQGTITLWPVPQDNTCNVEISSPLMLATGFTPNSSFDAPPGYLEAVRLNLAVRLAMEWDNVELKPGIAELASEALAKVQRRNAPTPQMDCNPGILPIRHGRSGFSYLTGDFDA